MAELVDALDLKSNVLRSVSVRVRPVAPKFITPDRKSLTYRPSFRGTIVTTELLMIIIIIDGRADSKQL